MKGWKMNEKEFLALGDRERDAWISHNLLGYELEYDGMCEFANHKDANAMLRVIERMRERGFNCKINIYEDWVYCEFDSINKVGAKMDDNDDPNLPLAVYIAAGRALEVLE
jgi:hypothetical protein